MLWEQSLEPHFALPWGPGELLALLSWHQTLQHLLRAPRNRRGLPTMRAPGCHGHRVTSGHTSSALSPPWPAQSHLSTLQQQMSSLLAAHSSI